MKFDLSSICSVENTIFLLLDEVDSILVDEARTPLIISGPAEESTNKYYPREPNYSALKKRSSFQDRRKNEKR